MAVSAKKAIRDTFVRLLNERPLSQITVRDIVDACGINRNTFYYHFRDLPQLVETIVNEDADRVIREHLSIDSIEACLNAIIGFALENRKAVMHIYNSVNRNLYEQYQWRVCEHAATTYVDGILSGHTIADRDRQMLIQYLKCVGFGVAIGWLESGMQEDIQAWFHRICELKRGDLEMIIARCEGN